MPAQSSSGLHSQVSRNLYPQRASSHSRDLHCPVPRDSNAAWKGSPGARRACCLSPSVAALVTDGSSIALDMQERRAHQKRAAPRCSHSPALRGCAARPRLRGPGAARERRAGLRCSSPAPSTYRESRGSGWRGKFKKGRERCRAVRGVGNAAWPGADLKGLQWKVEPF